MKAIVLGAGPAGCVAALALARGGHEVTLMDRELKPPGAASADEIFDTWDRPAIGQFRQPHNFLGRGRAILRDDFPDVYAELLTAGAGEIRQDSFLADSEREPGDLDLATITCRRPVIDAVLQAAVGRQPGVTFDASAVLGLRVSRGVHVNGVRLASGDVMGADIVVDATGRNSATSRWLSEAGAAPWPERTTDSNLLYYSRHYRFRETPLPYASLLGGPRGDLGYLAFAVFLGDNQTFCLCMMAPAWDKQWRGLRDPAAFERVARRLPGMVPWLDAAVPITEVLPMGSLRNTLREPGADGSPIPGLTPIGDARCHTNPTFAFGLSLSLSHATALAAAADRAADELDLVTTFEQSVGEDAAQRYEAVSAEDRDRVRLWSGDSINPLDRSDTMPLFLRTVVYRVAALDPEILRAVCRRINLLDSVDELATRHDLLDRAEALFGELPPPDAPPVRAAMLATLRATSP